MGSYAVLVHLHNNFNLVKICLPLFGLEHNSSSPNRGKQILTKLKLLCKCTNTAYEHTGLCQVPHIGHFTENWLSRWHKTRFSQVFFSETNKNFGIIRNTFGDICALNM